MSAARTDAIAYHASLADGWERRCEKRSFRMRQSVLLKCLQGRNLAGTVWLDAGCGTGTLSRAGWPRVAAASLESMRHPKWLSLRLMLPEHEIVRIGSALFT